LVANRRERPAGERAPRTWPRNQSTTQWGAIYPGAPIPITRPASVSPPRGDGDAAERVAATHISTFQRAIRELI
jgi:hypothetical protein